MGEDDPIARDEAGKRSIREIELRHLWEDLHRGLVMGASRAATRAFQARDDSDWEAFMLHAGMSLELLAKSVLAQINPLLIVADNHPASIIKIVTGNFLDDAGRLRTITLRTAIERLDALKIGLGAARQELDDLGTARNVIVHMGIADEDLGRRAGVAWVRAMVTLVDHAAFSRHDVFGDWVLTVEAILSDHESEDLKLYDERLAAARQRWGLKSRDLYGAARDAHRRGLADRLEQQRREDPSHQATACPVCQCPALLEIWIDAEPSWEYQDGLTEIVGFSLSARVQSLRCETCGLNLDSERLVQLSGALDDWAMSDDDLYLMNQLESDAYYEQARADWEAYG